MPNLDRQVQSKLAQLQQQNNQQAKSWQDIRNKLDVLLTSNNILKGTELRQRCLALDGMTIEERRTHITTNWGPLYTQKAEPLLLQLESLERVIAKTDESIENLG